MQHGNHDTDRPGQRPQRRKDTPKSDDFDGVADIVRLHDMVATVHQLGLPGTLDSLDIANDTAPHSDATAPFDAVRVLGRDDLLRLAQDRQRRANA